MGAAQISAKAGDSSAAESAYDRPFRVSEIWRHVPRAVWLVVLLHVLVTLCQTAVFPNFRAPDEVKHFDMIVSVQRGTAWPWPDPGTLPVNRGSWAGGFVPTGHVGQRLALADRPIPSRSHRRSFLARGGDTRTHSSNQMTQHAPLYYLGGAAVLASMGDWEDDPLDRVFLLLRWSNVLLLAPLPLLLYASARRLRLPEPVPLAASLFPLLVPELSRSGGSINNDNLLILAAAVLTLLLTRVLTGDTSRRTAVWVGAVTTVALLTKGLALVLPAWVVATYAVTLYRTRRLSTLGSLGWAAVITSLGLAWWVRNQVLFGAVLPNGLRTEPPDLQVRSSWENWAAAYVVHFIERMGTTFFVQDYGAMTQDHTAARLQDTTLWLARVAVVVVLAGVAVTLVRRVIPRLGALTLLLPTVLLAALVAKGSWSAFAVHGKYTAMQGRYLFAGAFALALVAVAPLPRTPQRFHRFLPLLLLALGLVMHLGTTAQSLSKYWAPRGTSLRTWTGLRESVEAVFRWYALPPAVLMSILVATTLVALVTAIALLHRSELSRGYPLAP
jgi:hypothetical protein